MSASVTVEAAMAVPIFFLAVICLIYLLELMAIGTAVRSGLQYAGKRAAQEAATAPVLMPFRLEADVVESIGADRLARSIVEGGSSGIDCSRSACQCAPVSENCLPYTRSGSRSLFFRFPWSGMKRPCGSRAGPGMRGRALAGRTMRQSISRRQVLSTIRTITVLTLDLSIRMASGEEVSSLRNESGGKYYACEHCGGGSGGAVYITSYGDRYHSSLSCSGLKRTVYAVPLSEAVGKGACSKCGH